MTPLALTAVCILATIGFLSVLVLVLATIAGFTDREIEASEFRRELARAQAAESGAGGRRAEAPPASSATRVSTPSPALSCRPRVHRRERATLPSRRGDA